MEVQAGVALDIRQVLEHDLLLQRHRGGGDHQRLAQMLGDGYPGQTIGHCLAGTGARFHHGHGRLAIAMAFIVQLDAAEQLRHLGNHHPLAVTRLERLVFEEGAIGRLDLAFEIIVEHGVSEAERG